MATIQEVLAQRTDLSSFLVHLTRERGGVSAKECLKSILSAGKVEARSPFGMAYRALAAANLSNASQRCVCFTETPLVHLPVLAEDIEGRQVKLAPYGLAIPRRVGRAAGINPVWYLDATPGHTWLTNPVNDLVKKAVLSNGQVPFEQSEVARLAPFLEQMGTWENSKKEFWWEREWRKVGDYHLPVRFIVIAPADEHAELKAHIDSLEDHLYKTPMISADWSLEQIIGRLAGFNMDELGAAL